ncbi:uncharacterized protein LOC124815031 [Hydra vulgaris]|uniref:uncharacterized protein LOC124815031 n=1 Tax=Hydra vulgaris TaxID=6087 RepID=UPI0032E9D1A4
MIVLVKKKKFFASVLSRNPYIGFGVFALKKFIKGDFLLEYAGEHISEAEACEREEIYSTRDIGSFIYFNITGSNGKFIDDSPPKYANSMIKRYVSLNQSTYLALYAIKDIGVSTELRYDYGDDPSKMTWRKEVKNLQPTIKSILSGIIGDSKDEINIKSLNLHQNSLLIHNLNSEDSVDFDIVDAKVVDYQKNKISIMHKDKEIVNMSDEKDHLVEEVIKNSMLLNFCTSNESEVHRKEPEVVKAISLPKREQREAFDLLRKKSIFQFNMNEVKKSSPTFIRERKGSDKTDISNLVVCVKCKGFYSKNYKPRHQLICGRENGQVIISILPVDFLLKIDCLDDDFNSVINKMIQDEVSDIAKLDPVILMIRTRINNGQKCKTEKKYEVEKKELDSANDASKMFEKENLSYLRLAIDELTKDANEIICGFKIQLQNLIKLASKILEANYLVNGINISADIVRDFISVFSMVEQEIFGGALYRILQKRNKSSR